MENESKGDRFKRVAERRTRAVLHNLRLISNCASRSNYSYTPEQVNKIFYEIDQAVKIAKTKFHIPKKKEFEL
jgi:hypothetical protein